MSQQYKSNFCSPLDCQRRRADFKSGESSKSKWIKYFIILIFLILITIRWGRSLFAHIGVELIVYLVLYYIIHAIVKQLTSYHQKIFWGDQRAGGTQTYWSKGAFCSHGTKLYFKKRDGLKFHLKSSYFPINPSLSNISIRYFQTLPD